MFRRALLSIAITMPMVPGGSALAQEAPSTLVLSTRTFGAYQAQPTLAESGGDSAEYSGATAGLQLNLGFQRQRGSRSLAVRAGSTAAYFPSYGGFSSVSSNVDADFSTPLGRHTRLQMQQSVRSSPFHMIRVRQAGAAAAEASSVDTGFDYATFRWKNRSIDTAVALQREVGRRSSVAVSYRTAATTMASTTFRSHQASASFLYKVSRHAAARVGYGRQIAAVGDTMGRYQTHDLDIGMDYSRPVSISRRTTLTFRTGAAIVPDATGSRLHATGSAMIQREIGRTWKASLDFGRGVQMTQRFAAPALVNSTGLQVSGQFGRTLTAAITSGISAGTIGSAGDGHAFQSVHVGARANVALTRNTSAYGEYLYGAEQVGQHVVMRPGYRRNFNHHEVRIGLTAVIPLLR